MEQLFQQLRHSDPAVRRAAIIQIGKRGDPQALSALKYVHQNDPEPALRELAYKAGAHIAKQAKARQSASPPPPPPPDPEPDQGGFKWYGDLFEDDAKEQPKTSGQSAKVDVSPKDEERGKAFLSRATDYYMRGDRSKAADNLAKALGHDPNLRRDPVANGLAQDITGLFGPSAFDAIQHKDTRKHMFMADRQQKTQQKLAETATDLTTVGIYLAGYWLLLVVGYLLIYYLLFNVFADNLDSVLPQQQGYSSIQYDVGTPTLIVGAILQSIWGTFSLATVGASIHVVARWVLVGSGTMLGFLKRLIPYMMTVMATFFAIYITFIITAEAVIFMFMLFAMTFGFLFVMYSLSQLVAKYYNLGGCGGCFAIVVGIILWFVMLVGASYAFFESVG